MYLQVIQITLYVWPRDIRLAALFSPTIHALFGEAKPLALGFRGTDRAPPHPSTLANLNIFQITFQDFRKIL
jgi:hypothetical protein